MVLLLQHAHTMAIKLTFKFAPTFAGPILLQPPKLNPDPDPDPNPNPNRTRFLHMHSRGDLPQSQPNSSTLSKSGAEICRLTR